MSSLPTLFFAAVLAMLPALSRADSLSQADVDSIVQKFQAAYADTFDRRDAKGMGALLTEDATLQNEWGGVTQGRGKIEALVAGLMAHLPEGTKLEDTALVSQLISPDVIVSQGISHRIVPGAAPVEMYFTRVLVRQDERWKLAATQIARPSTFPKPSPPPAN